MSGDVTYESAGVSLTAARDHTANIAALVSGGIGFAGAMALPPTRDALIVGCTDGVGTKIQLAQKLGRTDGLGQDLVAMCVNDLACTGASPLFFLDYLAVGKLDPQIAGAFVKGIARACEETGYALLGGETAEHPGVVAPDHLDAAGFACGIVERDVMLGEHRVVDGDVIVGVDSSGIHSNGFSLIRRLVDTGALAADADLLLAPTRLYTADVARLQQAGVELHAVAHITGGGMPENLPRVIPAGLRAHVDPTTWTPNAAIQAVLATGQVPEDDAWDTFNMGIGLCLILPSSDAERACELVHGSRVIGRIEPGEGFTRG